MSGNLMQVLFARRGRMRGMQILRAVSVGIKGLCAGIACLGVARSSLADNTVSTWNGSVGIWGNPTAWDIGIVPQTGTNSAILMSSQATLDASFTIGDFTLGGGLLNGTNDLTINGLMTWSGGAMGDTGVTHAIGGMAITGAGDKIMAGRLVVNDGVATWDAGNFIESAGAVFTNSGTFTTSFDGNLEGQGGAFFNNAGTLQKTAGTGGTNATIINPIFNNLGTVQVQAGRLVLSGGGSASGSFAVSAGSVLSFQSDYTLGAASGVSGAGNVSFELGNPTVGGSYAVGGTTTVSGGSVAFNSTASTQDLVLVGGLLTGTGTLTASGTVTWTGTILQGTGTLVASGTLDISGADHGLSARKLTNAGSGTWSAGNIQFSAGAILNNTGTLENNFGATMQTSGPNPGTFNNSGLFIKSGPDTTLINPTFINNGTARLTGGTLDLAGGGNAIGLFDLAGGTRLQVDSDYIFAPGSTISGAGTVEFAGGANTVSGTYNVSGRTEVFGGTTTFNGNVVNLGSTLALNGGFVAINTPLVNASKLDQFGGGIDGSGNVVFSDLVTWDSGPQKGSGTTTATAGLLIQGTSDKSLDTRTLVNAVGSSATWSAGNLFGLGSGTLRNDGTFTDTFDASFQVANGTPQFVNTGLFIKSGGTGVTSFGAAFNNSGTVRIDSGSLFVGNGTSTGNFNLSAGGIQFAGTYALGDGATITGTNKALLTGLLNVTGAASAKNVEQSPTGETTGPGNFTIDTFAWLGGRLTGSGTTTITSSISLAGSGKELNGRRLRINPGATAAWSAGDINIFAGSVLDNAGTVDNSFDGNLFQNGVVNNSGLFVKSAGNGVTASVASFNNSGTMRVASGLVYLGAGLSTGNFDLVGGPVQLAGGYTLGDGATITGTNALNVFGLMNVTGSASANFAIQSSSGETSGPGNLTIQHFTWTGGRLTGTGVTTIASDIALAGGGKEMDGRTLRILPDASALWSSGDIGGFPGAVIDNRGTFETNFDGNYLYASTQSAAMNNSGLLLKSGGTSRTVFNVFFNNTGTARVATGTMTLSGGGSSTGNFDLTGGVLELTGGYVLAQGTTISGTNSALIIGDVSITGNVSAKNVTQSAGVASGGGVFTVDNFTWQGGTQDSGGGMTLATTTLSFSTSAIKIVDGGILRIAAPAVAAWSAGDLRVGNGGSIENLGTFNATSDNSIFPGDGAASSFKNTGLFFKNGTAGFTSIFVPFNNTGIVRVGSGAISMAGGGSSSGQFDLLGGPMELGGGYVLASGATITGTNQAKFVGDVSIAGPVSAKNVLQTTGTASGAGTFTIESFSWKGGTLGGASVTSVTSALDMSGSQYTIDTRTLSIGAAATATWSSGTLFGVNGGRIDNAGLFIDSFDATTIYQTGVLPTIDNHGEFRKSAGTGVTNINFVFNNTGTARVMAGTLRLASGGSASGSFDVAANSVVELAFDYTLATTSNFTGAGLAKVTGGVTTVNGSATAANFELDNGTLSGTGNLATGQFAWKGGVLAGAGTTTVLGNMTINGSDFNLSARALTVTASATATWSAGDIRIAQGGGISNMGTFNIAGDVNALRIDGVDSIFNNAGTLRKNAGSNTSSFAGVVLNNTGTLEVSSGTLIVGVSQFDSVNAALTGGTWRVFAGGKLDLGGGPGIATNFADVTLDGATANFPKINDLADNRGAFAIKDGKQFFTGGTFSNTGTITADSTSGMLFGNVFTNAGAYTSAGTTYANFEFNSGTFTQTGPFTLNVQMINNGTGIADIGGVQTWGSGAHLVVNGGSVILRTDAGAGGAKPSIDANGGTTQLKVSQHLSGLNVNGGVVKLDAGGNKIIRTSGYAPGTTGQLDLANNRMIVDYAVGTPIDVIASQLQTGYNAAGTHWAGPGLISSTAASDPTAGLGYAEASQVPGLKASFGGESITGPAVLIRYTKLGDANLDGVVNFGDFQRLELGFGQPGHWFNGDFNYDGMVDRADLGLLIQNYGKSIGLPAAPVPAAELASIEAFAASVPEPGMLGVIGIGAMMLCRRRRANRTDL